MQLAVGDVDEGRDVAAQVDQRVQFDRRLGRPEGCPRKQRQTQIDGRGIERVDGVLEVHAEGFVEVEPARDANQVLRELGVDAPVARFVGVGQRAARHRSANPKVIELGRLRTQAGLDVAQTLAIGELRERHAAKLIGATEIAHATIAAVALDDAIETSSTADAPSTARTPTCLTYMTASPAAKNDSFAHFGVQVGDTEKMEHCLIRSDACASARSA